MSNSLIYLQQKGEGLHPVCFQLSAKAAVLSDKRAGVFIGRELTQKLKEDLEKTGLDRIYVYFSKTADIFQYEIHDEAVRDCIKKINPEIVLFGATLEGRMLAPMIGAAFKTGVTADCTALSVDEEGRLVQTRPAFGGRVMASILTKNARPQVATIRPGIFLDCEIKSVKNEIKIMELPQNIKTKLLIKEARRLNKETDEQCDHIIAVGGGLKTKDELGLFQELADKMNAKLMCSRALVERGWMTQDKQIGLSGQSVSSEYLLTFGISGSVQFLSGVKGVKKLCAVCNDKKADIFDVADLPVLGDMIEIAKAMVKKEI